MSRTNRISLGFNDSEYDDLTERAKQAHLKLGNYIRWFLFNAHLELQQPITITHQETPSVYTLPYKASPEVIEKIKSGKDPYVDPYQQARLAAKNVFSASGGLGELQYNIRMMVRGGKILHKIPKKEMKEIEEGRKERRIEVNKMIKELEEKGIKVE